MSREFQKIQFELFEREEINGMSKTEGTGLGLPIVKRLADMLGAGITCVSEKGKGTAYTLTFRLEKDRQHNTSGQDVQEKTNVRDFAGRHVLLVEDNEMNREIALYILQEMELRVDTAENGVQAVEKVKASAEDIYDLILMDVQMPYMNGYEATRAIRSLDNRILAKTPIIAMTANAFEEDRRNALEAGMNRHIAKPVEISKLTEALEEILE